jgi:hypothetical protein
MRFNFLCTWMSSSPLFRRNPEGCSHCLLLVMLYLTPSSRMTSTPSQSAYNNQTSTSRQTTILPFPPHASQHISRITPSTSPLEVSYFTMVRKRGIDSPPAASNTTAPKFFQTTLPYQPVKNTPAQLVKSESGEGNTPQPTASTQVQSVKSAATYSAQDATHSVQDTLTELLPCTRVVYPTHFLRSHC